MEKTPTLTSGEGHEELLQEVQEQWPTEQRTTGTTHCTRNIICAETAIDELPRTVDNLGLRGAMITCGPTILKACNVVPRVQEALGERYVGTYSGVAPHSPVETVEAGVEMAREVQPDVFISVGGGSTHDTTKAMATLLAEGRRHPRLRDYIRAAPTG